MSWAPDYATSTRLKEYLRIHDNADDYFISTWITTVSRNIDDYCGRQFGKVDSAEARTYRPVWDRHECARIVVIDDLQDVTGISIVDENSTAITGFTYDPVNNVKKGKPYERIMLGTSATSFTGDLTITAIWGRTSVPSSVEEGIYLQANRLSARRDSPFGISGSPSEQGEIRLLAQLDPDFKTSLKPFIRRWWVAS